MLHKKRERNFDNQNDNYLIFNNNNYCYICRKNIEYEDNNYQKCINCFKKFHYKCAEKFNDYHYLCRQ
jgi:hypothetical protein